MEKRVIKFRAFDAKENKMYTPEMPFIGAGSWAMDIAICIDGKAITPNAYSLDYGNRPNVPELIFMQFTGLLDTNGKEVYEGDRMRVWAGSGFERVEGFGVVEFEQQASQYWVKWKDQQDRSRYVPLVAHSYADGQYYFGNGEVIGNIHQHSNPL